MYIKLISSHEVVKIMDGVGRVVKIKIIKGLMSLLKVCLFS
jgi:hypothetical protein